MANIRNVAKEANVSITTASRILSANSNIYKVAESTRERVLLVASKLGYTVPESYRRKKKIACVINITAEMHADSYYQSILGGLKEELSKDNYSVDYIHSKYDFGDREITEKLFSQKIEGFVLMTDIDERILDAIKKKTNNIVCVDTNILGYDNIRYNRFEAGCLAMKHLINNNHKRIAYVGSHMRSTYSLHFGRYDAYRVMQKRYNLEINPAWIVDCKWQQQLCYDKTKNLLKSPKMPSAIFFASDYMAVAGCRAIIDSNKTIPSDISIIGLSDIDEIKDLNPPLTTIEIPKTEIGHITARTLLSRINGDNTAPKQIYLPTRLIERMSVARLKG